MIPHRADEPQVHVCANESWRGLVTVAIGTQASYNITPERAEELAAELVAAAAEARAGVRDD